LSVLDLPKRSAERNSGSGKLRLSSIQTLVNEIRWNRRFCAWSLCLWWHRRSCTGCARGNRRLINTAVTANKVQGPPRANCSICFPFQITGRPRGRLLLNSVTCHWSERPTNLFKRNHLELIMQGSVSTAPVTSLKDLREGCFIASLKDLRDGRVMMGLVNGCGRAGFASGDGFEFCGECEDLTR
jgi:hypothetical protein